MSKITLVTGAFDDFIYVDGVKVFSSKDPITFHEAIVYLEPIYYIDSPINSLEIKIYDTDWSYLVGSFPKYLKDVKLAEKTK